MTATRFSILNLTLLLFPLLILTLARPFICPDLDEIGDKVPCFCSVDDQDDTRGNLECRGPLLDQFQIDEFLALVKTKNGDGPYALAHFSVFNTNLTTIDLDALAGFDIISFRIADSPQLTSFGSRYNASTTFFAESITIGNSGLSVVMEMQRMASFVQSIPGRGPKTLRLDNNKFTGIKETYQLMPAINLFLDLTLFSMDGNDLSQILDGNVVRGNLQYIHLSNANISNLGRNAFMMKQGHNNSLTIFLDNNELRDENIHPWFIPPGSRPDEVKPHHVFMRNNSFDHLSEGTFGKLMFPGSIYTIDFSGNKFICDFRMQWLRRRKAELEARVIGVECQNDPGNDIFTTKLVSPYFGCPAPDEIFPCTCVTSEVTNGSLSCSGPLITQETIENLIRKVKTANGDPETLYLSSLTLENLSLTSIDLNPVKDVNVTEFKINNCNLLASVKEPLTNSSKFHVDKLGLENNAELDNEAIGTILSFVNSSTGPIFFNAASNKIGQVSRGCMIIPGISNFPLIQELNLSHNQIKEVLEGSFCGVNGLRVIRLENSTVTKIGAGAFDMGPEFDQNVTIFLAGNKLSDNFETGFIPQSSRAFFTLNLTNNNFEVVSESTFGNFMFPGPISHIDFSGNTFVCDNRMKWLRSRKSRLENRTTGIECQNDPGKTIFDTNLVAPAFFCPPSNEIVPCSCSTSGVSNGSLSCSGGTVTEFDIENLIEKVRGANLELESLNLSSFSLTNLSLTSVDLNPLKNLNIDQLVIERCHQLTNIADPLLTSIKFNATEIHLENNALLDNEAVEKILSFIDPSYGPIVLNAASTKLSDAPQGSPIIPGIFKYPKIQDLTLSHNPIQEVHGGSFLGITGLTIVRLDSTTNAISKIGQGAFDMGPGFNQSVTIFLGSNKLSNDHFDVGFIPLGRNASYSLNLVNNSFEHLEREKFEELMHPSGPILKLEMSGNPFVCDGRMQWIRADAENLKGNIIGVYCKNDPGETIFTTNLVSSGSRILVNFAVYSLLILIVVTMLNFN